jgi:phosphate uptake regulator
VIGPEVIEETQGSILLQDLSDPSELSSEKCLRRMHLTVRAMLEDAFNALKTGDEALAHEVALRGQGVNRLYWVVAKQHHLAHAAPTDGAIARRYTATGRSRSSSRGSGITPSVSPPAVPCWLVSARWT